MSRCGSGEVSEALARISPSSFCISTDVNHLATTKTAQLLHSSSVINVDLVLCDLFTAFRSTVRFDVILFNPPYVPTDQHELKHALKERDIYASWAGGKDGRQVIDNFLVNVNSFLSDRGVVYLVTLEINKPNEITSVAEVHGLNVCQVLKRKAGIETLYILRLSKQGGDG